MTVSTQTRREKGAPDSAAAYAIEIEGLSIWYRGVCAVRHLSLHVPYGSIYGLTGPSGSGKTATIRTLATVQQPRSGTVLVDGIDVRAEPAAVRERIGYLPDVSGVYECLTVRETMDFYSEIYRIQPRQRHQTIDDLLELVGLTEQKDHPVRQLSRGMRQQLCLARCLIHDPQILLLDEPAAGMDPRARLELRDILDALSRFGKTVLISSHMLSELATVCTHLGIVQTGELVAEGPIDAIMAGAEHATLEDIFLRVTDPEVQP